MKSTDKTIKESHPSIQLNQVEEELQTRFKERDKISFLNHKKVADSFKALKIGTEHFTTTTGYGHDDIGRQKFDELFAHIFNAESGIARVNFVSGTHAISCAILGNLKPGDELVFALDKPYDTLNSLIKFLQDEQNVNVKIIQHKNWQNFKSVLESINKEISSRTNMVAIQRSRGYCANRPTINISQIQSIIKTVKDENPNAICFVDNCYGEFVEEREPSDVGADLVAGSLIKNPGGGIVLTGGYVVGKKELINKTADRLTCPGVGSEGGPNFNQGRLLFQGIYMAPMIVAEMVKSNILISKVLSELNIPVSPLHNEFRSDTILRIDFGNREKLISFCKTLQENSPVDSHLTPYPAQTPGYSDELIMAAGTFIEGSTSELSADGPLREPYSAFIQGGLSYAYTKIFLEQLIEQM